MEGRDSDDVGVVDENATGAPSRLPPMGKANTYEGDPPLHTLPFAIEHNVARIARQVADGRKTTYD